MDLQELWRLLPEILTKHMIWRIVQQIYDPLGLASRLLLKSKLILREVCIMRIDWDQAVPEILRSKFVDSLKDRAALADVSLSRSLVPDNLLGLPTIIGFCDGSSSAYSAVVYLRWPTEDGFKIVFVTAKTHVAPL